MAGFFGTDGQDLQSVLNQYQNENQEEADESESIPASAGRKKEAEKPEAKVEEPAFSVVEGTFVIPEGVTVEGKICTKSDVAVEGSVSGSIEAGNVAISSKRNAAAIKSSGHVVIGEKCVVVGDITADSVENHGAVKGKITAKQRVSLYDGAVIAGDIETSSIEIPENAAILGNIHLTGRQNNIDVKQIFGES